MPSQSTDMDQYLDELFMPILDSNKDMECDACLVAASIKEGAHSKKETDTVDSIFNDVTDAIVDDQQPLSDAETLASFIKCSGYEEESRDQHNQGYMKSTPDSISASASPFQSIGINRLIIRQLQQGAMAPHHDTSFELVSSETLRIYDPSPIQPNDGKHSLLQFSLYHFRQGPAK